MQPSAVPANGSHPLVPPINLSLGQSQYPNVPEYINAMQQQAAAQMQMQTALMTKLFEALESPKGDRSRSRGRNRSRSRNSKKERGRSASSHSRRSRSRHADGSEFYDEDLIDEERPARSATPLSRNQRSNRVLERGTFPADGEVWVDEDENSAFSSLPNSLPNSRPASATMHVFANASEHPTPRMERQFSRPRPQRS